MCFETSRAAWWSDYLGLAHELSQPGPLTTEAFRALAVVPSPVVTRNVLLTDPRFWAQYEVRPIEIDGLWFNLLQRKDTLSAAVGRR